MIFAHVFDVEFGESLDDLVNLDRFILLILLVLLGLFRSRSKEGKEGIGGKGTVLSKRRDISIQLSTRGIHRIQ